ncbi:hypothetical protein P153DRAFT_351629 [Dothidotthia symphoricarpi CBS 119687]|uniref:Smr domain-containing protein n=1 Tax=Dothidotthia symphoricarpi CBS 119687 TaxID=1392245 RepID=A0A6A5ZW83_9PLEO|nr:uncharacterized protein P153DRAFT_351629 [Dothidotthia symphoricarpi CBS 119687]KAF2124002.1 hypothetical protein P153DRAFT_351629 [Dothidotthia symphoricarpi CBS 119687]
MDEDLRILEEEYCPLVDAALLSAVYSDYAGQPNAIELVRELLDSIKASALEEQLTDFDPSGSSGAVQSDSKGVDSSGETWATQTIITDNTLSTLSLDNRSVSGSETSGDSGYFRDTEHFSAQTKGLLLAETFPTLRPELIAYTLKKCDDDLSKATDELLNHVYFEDARTSPTEDGPVVKGVDAFSEDYHVPQRGKKGKGKRQKKVSLSGGSAFVFDTDRPATPPANKWLNSSKDIEFITSRTNLPAKLVSSLYHESSASLSATILILVRKDIKAHEKDGEPDAGLVQDAIMLNGDFPTIDLEYALAVVRLTSPSTSQAHELAKALTEQPASETGGKGGIKLDLRYAPIDLSEPTLAPRLPDLPTSARPRDTASVARARSEAFQNASAAYRKGKSTPLMKQAAGYYAQEGRDLNANLRALSEADADALVSSQSSSTYLDLHGVTVASATRIARQRTQAWWSGLGEQRIPEWSGAGRRGGGNGYRIIVGLGRHSVDGRGKLGPAVAKALAKEGWKLEIGSGELLVTGLARRK